MTIFIPCAERLRAALATLNKMSSSNVERFLQAQGEVRQGLTQVIDILEGNFELAAPETPKPKRTPRKDRTPHTIKAHKGNVVSVDFKNRRVVIAPEKPKAK